MFLALSFLFVAHALSVPNTTSTCGARGKECSFASKSLVRVGKNRVLKNRVRRNFVGRCFVASDSSGSSFVTDFNSKHGMVFSRMFEGIVVPEVAEEGYPISLENYMKDPNASISYTAQWGPRKLGFFPLPTEPRGDLHNGAQIFLTAPSKYQPGTIIPNTPYSVEIRIYNRYPNFKTLFQTVACASPYKDGTDNYRIRAGIRTRGARKTRVYLLFNTNNFKKTDMDINTTKMFSHLILAEGRSKGTSARFAAQIKSLGRVSTAFSVRKTPPKEPSLESLASNESEPSKSGNRKMAPGVSAGTKPPESQSNETKQVGGGGTNWELIGSIIGAFATIIGALLGVYLVREKRWRYGQQNTVIEDTVHQDRI